MDEPLDVIIKKLRDNARVPTKGTSMSAAYDVYASKINNISRSVVKVRLGISMQPPEGYCIRFSPRSSFTGSGWVLANSPALGDPDYEGEYMLVFEAIPNRLIKSDYPHFPYQVGDRVAQMWIDKIIPFEFREGEFINKTERGHGRFGSTGR